MINSHSNNVSKNREKWAKTRVLETFSYIYVFDFYQI